MPRHKKPKSSKSNTNQSNIPVEKTRVSPAGRKRLFFLLPVLGLMVASIVGALFFFIDSSSDNPVSAAFTTNSLFSSIPLNYVGANTCKDCHSGQFAAWKQSHHGLAMQEANAHTVLGDFNNSTFRHYGIESSFFKREDQFFVRTEGPNGKLAEYPVRYTFGVTPLQQYLIEFPGGRYQALGIAWDSRPLSDGGQRWFHLYPNEKIDYTDQLHWSGRYQNWNLQCAECHSTNLKKGYDAATDSYQTTFNEINVSCESCHGPASRHIVWANQSSKPFTQNDAKGLTVDLQSRWREAWKFPSVDAKFAQRDRPASDELMNTCWACHARRATLAEGRLPGLPLEDSHRPALLTQPTYYADGQQREEDYIWGSFRQSKMFQKGVTCMDCHEPHALRLRAEGNAVCARCHNAATFNNSSHHHHQTDSEEGRCIECHAPKQNYMVIDGRHDHSFCLPRPDLSIELGSPNACTQCHRDRQPEWAANSLDKWYGKSWRQRPHYGSVLHSAGTQGIKALPALLELARNPTNPTIVRATALTLISPLMRPELLDMARSQLKDSDPSVRIAALGLLEPLDPFNRSLSASPLLSDPVLGVRIEAARILADIPEARLPPDKRSAFKQAFNEYIDSLKLNADWPATNVNLGNLLMRQGKIEDAIAAYERALVLDPYFAGAYVNLANAFRQTGRDEEGEKQLRQGIALLPEAANLHHALGLLLVRKGDKASALAELKKAADLAPNTPRYAYVYAVGLHSSGRLSEALSVLKAADKRTPYNLEILQTLISIHQETGDNRGALAYARKAGEILPGNAGIKRLVMELEAAK